VQVTQNACYVMVAYLIGPRDGMPAAGAALAGDRDRQAPSTTMFTVFCLPQRDRKPPLSTVCCVCCEQCE